MAKLWDVSRRQARRRMLAIERDHPGTLRRGPRGELRSTAEAIAQFVKGATTEPRVVVDVRRLRERVTELEKRIDVVVLENAEFRKQAHGWYRRIQALESRR
jgi:hypothetical protein